MSCFYRPVLTRTGHTRSETPDRSSFSHFTLPLTTSFQPLFSPSPSQNIPSYSWNLTLGARYVFWDVLLSLHFFLRKIRLRTPKYTFWTSSTHLPKRRYVWVPPVTNRFRSRPSYLLVVSDTVFVPETLVCVDLSLREVVGYMDGEYSTHWNSFFGDKGREIWPRLGERTEDPFGDLGVSISFHSLRSVFKFFHFHWTFLHTDSVDPPGCFVIEEYKSE